MSDVKITDLPLEYLTLLSHRSEQTTISKKSKINFNIKNEITKYNMKVNKNKINKLTKTSKIEDLKIQNNIVFKYKNHQKVKISQGTITQTEDDILPDNRCKTELKLNDR